MRLIRNLVRSGCCCCSLLLAKNNGGIKPNDMTMFLKAYTPKTGPMPQPVQALVTTMEDHVIQTPEGTPVCDARKQAFTGVVGRGGHGRILTCGLVVPSTIARQHHNAATMAALAAAEEGRQRAEESARVSEESARDAEESARAADAKIALLQQQIDVILHA